MRMRKKSLIKELTWTVLCLSAALFVMWLLFYVNIYNLIQRSVMKNMEQVSEQIISEMERAFLQLEETSFALSQNENVKEFLQENEYISFVEKAGKIENTIDKLAEDTSFMDNVILYNNDEMYYRYSGNIANTGVKRLIHVINQKHLESHVKIHLDDANYIGYVSTICYDSDKVGTIVILTDENDIYRLFEQMAGNDDMKIALAAEGQIVLTNEKEYKDISMEEIRNQSSYVVSKQIGFTPFELLVSYENTKQNISILFMVSMFVMAILLFSLLEVFLHFWRKKFFVPIQSVITEVEGIEGGKGNQIPLTGMEHFDGLVCGINEMVERIEQKEKEVYEATYSLQEAELKKQKALIVSLKKQISAHFTVNVLNIIKALSSMGENEKAGLLCDGLSFLLRYANAGDSFISGMDEFFVLEKYAEIMEIRYPKKFIVEVDIVDELEKIELPRMLLQPIIENSIVHGIIGAELEDFGRIHVYSQITEETVMIMIEDNGKGMTSEQLEELRIGISTVDSENVEVEGLSHVALLNIQRRIMSYFGKGNGISVDSVIGHGTKVTVKLPSKRRFL